MRQNAAADHLDLWRGIDDAVWREALRIAPSPSRSIAPPRSAERRVEERRVEERSTARVATKVPEPV